MTVTFLGGGIGHVLVLSLGLVLGPHWLGVVCAIPNVFLAIGLLYLPMTPRFLMKQVFNS